jgi:hypothetical protein
LGGGRIFLGRGDTKGTLKNVKWMYTPLGFLGIFLVYAFIMNVKNNIKPQNKHNLFRIG